MKIALITPDLSLTGIPKYIELLSMALPKVGNVQVEVICFYPPLDRRPTLESQGIRVHVVFPEDLQGSRMEFVRRLKSILAAIKPDCAHTNGGNYNLMTSWALFTTGIPEITSWHGWMTRKHFITRKYLLSTLKEMMFVHLQQLMGTQFITSGDYVNRPGILKRHITKILTGVPVTAKRKKDIKYPIIFLEAARLVESKGAEDLLKAVVRLDPNENFEVWLAGDGPQKPALEKLAQDLSLQNVRFLGWRPDIQELLRQADVAVLPSYSESFGLFVLESMMLGLPVVAYNIPAMQALIAEEGGILVEAGNIAALSGALERLLGDAELRASMGEAAHRRAVEHFSDTACAKQTLAVYQKQICHHKARLVHEYTT